MKYIPTNQLLESELEKINQQLAKKHKGFSSGYKALDKDLLGGFKIGNLYCIGSVKSMGKTMVALNILTKQLSNLAINEVIVFVSTGTSKSVIIQKILAIAIGIDLSRMQGEDLSADEITSFQNHSFLTILKSNSLIIFENNAPTFEEISNILYELIKAEKVPKMLFIDCLQDIQLSNENRSREQAIHFLLKTIKVMALQVQIPVLITSKISKRVFYRTEGPIPKAEDLQYSRLISDVCDYIYMVLRPRYYQIPGEPDFETITEELHLYCRKNKYLKLNILKFRTDIRKYQVTNDLVLKPIAIS
jgi:replicative DNA helicase